MYLQFQLASDQIYAVSLYYRHLTVILLNNTFAVQARGHRVMTVSPRYDQYKDSWDTDVLIDVSAIDVSIMQSSSIFFDRPKFTLDILPCGESPSFAMTSHFRPFAIVIVPLILAFCGTK